VFVLSTLIACGMQVKSQQCILQVHCILYVTDVFYGTLPDVEVSDNSNSIHNEEDAYPLSEEEIESDSTNVSHDSVGSQKFHPSYSTAEDDMVPSCSKSLSQDVSIFTEVN